MWWPPNVTEVGGTVRKNKKIPGRQVFADWFRQPHYDDLDHRARLGPRVSPRGQTLAEPYTPRLGISVGASGLRVLDGLKHRLSTFVRKISVSVTESQTVKEAQISPRTTVPFPSGCSPLVHI